MEESGRNPEKKRANETKHETLIIPSKIFSIFFVSIFSEKEYPYTNTKKAIKSRMTVVTENPGLSEKKMSAKL